jgi:hypothetical protein
MKVPVPLIPDGTIAIHPQYNHFSSKITKGTIDALPVVPSE